MQPFAAISAAFVAMFVCLGAVGAQPASADATGASAIGYTSVAEALDALKAKPGVTVNITKPDSWVIVTEPGNGGQWSFAPSGHYAHPAVVRRILKVHSEGGVYIEMSALCQAEKDSCDRLLKEFEQLNEQIRQSVRNRLQRDRGQN
jgi:hypothetical protein